MSDILAQVKRLHIMYAERYVSAVKGLSLSKAAQGQEQMGVTTQILLSNDQEEFVREVESRIKGHLSYITDKMFTPFDVDSESNKKELPTSQIRKVKTHAKKR